MHTKIHIVLCSFSSTKVHWNFGVLQQYDKFGVLFVCFYKEHAGGSEGQTRERDQSNRAGFPETIPNHILHLPVLVLKMSACLKYPLYSPHSKTYPLLKTQVNCPLFHQVLPTSRQLTSSLRTPASLCQSSCTCRPAQSFPDPNFLTTD